MDLLSILHDICDRIIVPQAVVEELRVGGKQGIEVPNVLLFDWIEIRSPLSNSARPLIQDLGDGETEVLLLALENPGSLVILDDNHARTYAQLNKIPVIGTCGILLKAKSEGYINQLTPILDILERKGFYISKEFKQLVIRLAHE